MRRNRLGKPGATDGSARNLEAGGRGGGESTARTGATGGSAARPERRVKAGPPPAGPERAAVAVITHLSNVRCRL